MSDKVLRHVIAFIAMLCFALVYWVAYVSGSHGWLWTSLSIVIVYGIVYKLVDA